MNLSIKTEKKDISELSSLLEMAKAIKDGYIIKEEIEEVKLERYFGEDIEIKDGFYSLIVFDENTEIKITRDGKDLYFRQLSENAGSVDVSDTLQRTYYLKGKYDKDSHKWWESAFSPEFDYPRESNQDIPHKSRAGLKVKIYQDEEGKVRYFRFCGYESFTIKREKES